MNSKKPLLPKSSLVIRLVAGMYLIYLAYELGMELWNKTSEGAPVPLIIIAVILFAVFGLALTIVSGKAFIKGEFQGGIMDVSDTLETKKDQE